MELREQVISSADLPGRLASLPGWHADGSGIARDYPAGWDEAAAMIPEIASLATEMEHRPDLDIRWPGLRVFLTTHTAGDVVTELDLAMAARIDAIGASRGVAGLA
jgi:4a-hydroxytetrahydrobiopterin dehydratase